MSCVVIVTVATLPSAVGAFAGLISAAVAAAAASCGMRRDESATGFGSAANAVDLRVGNAGDVAGGLSAGKAMTFRGDGMTVVFYQDAEGKSAVRVSGNRSEAELRELGERMAKRVVQQYAYHRVVTEMRARRMNIVEEEVEEDGTVRMLVRVRQG